MEKSFANFAKMESYVKGHVGYVLNMELTKKCGMTADEINELLKGISFMHMMQYNQDKIVNIALVVNERKGRKAATWEIRCYYMNCGEERVQTYDGAHLHNKPVHELKQEENAKVFASLNEAWNAVNQGLDLFREEQTKMLDMLGCASTYEKLMGAKCDRAEFIRDSDDSWAWKIHYEGMAQTVVYDNYFDTHLEE